jgi:hypothetical protein
MTNLEPNNESLNTDDNAQPTKLFHQISETTTMNDSQINESQEGEGHNVTSETELEIPEDSEDDNDQDIKDPTYTRPKLKDNIAQLLRQHRTTIETELELKVRSDYKVSLDELMHLMPFSATACNARALIQHHIIAEGTQGNKVLKANPLPSRSFGSILQVHPTCHPNWCLDFGPLWMRNEKIRQKLNSKSMLPTDEFVSMQYKTFFDKESNQHVHLKTNIDIQTQEFVDDTFKALLLTFVGRPQFVSAYYTYTNHHHSSSQSSLPTPLEVDRIVHLLNLIESKGCTIGHCFTEQYDCAEELCSFTDFRTFLKDYAPKHNSHFLTEVLNASTVDGKVDRRRFTDLWQTFAGQYVPKTFGKTNKFLFHIYKAMKCIESTYGIVFGDETLSSVPIGYGAEIGWKHLRTEDLSTPDTAETIKQEHALLREKRKGRKKQKACYWDEVMTKTEAKNMLNRIKQLSDWGLQCMLMARNSKGDIIDMITKEAVGYRAIDVFFCECYRVLKKRSRTYNISAIPRLDLSYGHPFKLSNKKLSINTDRRIQRLIEEAFDVFKIWCGFSQEWSEIKQLPPSVFCTDSELESFF